MKRKRYLLPEEWRASQIPFRERFKASGWALILLLSLPVSTALYRYLGSTDKVQTSIGLAIGCAAAIGLWSGVTLGETNRSGHTYRRIHNPLQFWFTLTFLGSLYLLAMLVLVLQP